MASVAQPRVRTIRSSKVKSETGSREQAILKEFESFFERHIGAMTPSQLQQYERNVEKLVDEAKAESSEAALVHGTEQSSPAVRSR